MNRTFLKGLGLEGDVIESIMTEYGKNVEGLNNKITTLTDEKNTATEALKKFEGVDVEGLKNQAETIKSKYESQIKDMKIDNAIANALSSANVKHSDLLSSKFDRTKIEFKEDGTISGIDEQLNGFKESYADLFTSSVSGQDPANPDGQGQKETFDFGFTSVRENN
ncbi:phage scaffolding protein [uncultured Parvimonas sp.]|uniref:phage scaffolding protein n=1 Tax=uncultured Parvimonas sp. TaxID=747372 RepID=UPI00259A9766|nr:phage scaffolding protein [uncultured Parvimonas sp.]